MTAVGQAAGVPLGEFAIAAERGVLAALGLGSCVAVLLYDPSARAGGLAHVMLPSLALSRVRDRPARTAETAVPWLLHRVQDVGALVPRLRAWLVGGATMFADLLPSGAVHIGERNVLACRNALRQLGIPIAGEAVGGARGRSVWLDVAAGTVTVRETGGEPYTI